MKNQLLTLNMPPVMEELVIDALLSSEHCEGFTTSTVNGHSVNSLNYTITEQVTGRQKRIQIEILCTDEESDALLIELKQFAGAGIRYWRTAVLSEGQLV